MQKMCLERISFMLSHKCNLRCRLCAVYAPYYPKPPHQTYEEMTQSIYHFFEIVDSVGIFVLTGGEPLLYKDLPEVLDFLQDYRSRIIQRLEIVTNGTLVPSEKLLQSMHRLQVSVLVDDYGPDISQKFTEVIALLKQHEIQYTIRENRKDKAYCDGWFDVSEFWDIPKSREAAQKMFDQCLISSVIRCNSVVGGKIFLCPTAVYLDAIGKLPLNPQEYFDLFDDTRSLGEKKKALAAYNKIDYISACAFCKGWVPGRKRHVPAEQM